MLFSRLLRASAVTVGGCYSAAIAYSVVEHDALDSPLWSSLVTTAMWMRGSPLHFLHSKLSDVPTQITDVTAERLESCLKKSGRLPAGGKVAAIEVEQFGLNAKGETKGLLSDICRVTCTYTGELPTALPNSFIVKMSPEEFGGRLTGRLCFFKSEVDFYNKNLGEFGGIRTPDCYFAEYNRMTGEVTLFLEDLTATRLTTVDVGNGWTVEQAKDVLSVAAKLHGRYWGMGNTTTTPDLSETVSIRHRPTLEICAEMYRRNVDAMAPIVKKVLGIEMSDAFLDFVRESKPHMDTLTDSCYFTLDQTLTLCHSDLRTENVFVNPAGGEEPIIIDFQGVALGSGACDVNRTLMGNLATRMTEAVELELMVHYHTELCRARPDLVYPFLEFAFDYECGLLFNVFKLGMAVGDAETIWKRNREPMRIMFECYDRAIQRWDLHRLFEQGCRRVQTDVGTGTVTMTPLTDADRLAVLPDFITSYVAEISHPTMLTSAEESVVSRETWREWLGRSL
eukprot:m.43984 g.43984  ORF g.43984 m.43984 type:complete len:509 (+) comp14878_c0_seq1:67-1593(+)